MRQKPAQDKAYATSDRQVSQSYCGQTFIPSPHQPCSAPDASQNSRRPRIFNLPTPADGCSSSGSNNKMVLPQQYKRCSSFQLSWLTAERGIVRVSLTGRAIRHTSDAHRADTATADALSAHIALCYTRAHTPKKLDQRVRTGAAAAHRRHCPYDAIPSRTLPSEVNHKD